MNWGLIEHRAETRTLVLLVSGSAVAGLFLWLRWGWLPYVLVVWMFMATVMHIWGRLAHVLEKWHWKHSKWSPRGGYKK